MTWFLFIIPNDLDCLNNTFRKVCIFAYPLLLFLLCYELILQDSVQLQKKVDEVKQSVAQLENASWQ